MYTYTIFSRKVFEIITLDQWDSLYEDFCRSYGCPTGAMFLFPIVAIGSYIIMNLFLAILIQSLNDSAEVRTLIILLPYSCLTVVVLLPYYCHTRLDNLSYPHLSYCRIMIIYLFYYYNGPKFLPSPPSYS